MTYSNIAPFKLERYFALHEFSAKYLLSASDCEALSLSELLALADQECRMLWDGLSLGYTESLGFPELRNEICKLYEKIDPNQTLAVVPEEGILIALTTILRAGDEAIVISPAYQSLSEIALSLSCTVHPWMVEPGNGTWFMDLESLKKKITAKTKLLVINFPHNPTGFLMERKELDAVLELAREHDLYVFNDEMYRFLEYDDQKRLPSVADLYEKGIALSGMSKTFALPGLRIGWLATQNQELYDRWKSFKDYTTICSSAPSEILALIGLRNREYLIKRSLGIIQENLKIAESFFSEFRDVFEWRRPTAGSIAFPRLKLEIPVEAFCKNVLDEKNVMIAPGSLFESDGNYFRLGLGRKNFPVALAHLRDYLRSK